jgi:hypothetical protein
MIQTLPPANLPVESPKAIGNPINHHIMAPKQASSTFFSKIFFVFFARTDPASSKAKPHCLLVHVEVLVIVFREIFFVR